MSKEIDIFLKSQNDEVQKDFLNIIKYKTSKIKIQREIHTIFIDDFLKISDTSIANQLTLITQEKLSEVSIFDILYSFKNQTNLSTYFTFCNSIYNIITHLIIFTKNIKYFFTTLTSQEEINYFFKVY